MAMSKQDFIALADNIRTFNEGCKHINPSAAFTDVQIANLADFCRSQNGSFMRERWTGYIKGENGPNGGSIKR